MIMFKRFTEELAESRVYNGSPPATILSRVGHRMTRLSLLKLVSFLRTLHIQTVHISPHNFLRSETGKVAIYVCLSALHFFVKLERNGISLWHYVYVC